MNTFKTVQFYKSNLTEFYDKCKNQFTVLVKGYPDKFFHLYFIKEY